MHELCMRKLLASDSAFICTCTCDNTAMQCASLFVHNTNTPWITCASEVLHINMGKDTDGFTCDTLLLRVQVADALDAGFCTLMKGRKGAGLRPYHTH